MLKGAVAIALAVGQALGLVLVAVGLGDIYAPLEKIAVGATVVVLGVLAERKAA